MKFLITTALILMSIIIQTSMKADIVEIKKEYLKFNNQKSTNEYLKIINSIPTVKFKSESNIKSPKSLNFLYFTKLGGSFNNYSYKYIANNTQNLKGFNDDELTFKNTLDFNSHYSDLKRLKNPISIVAKKKSLSKYIQDMHKGLNYNDIYTNEYYSPLKIKSISSFNIKNLQQDIIFDFNQSKSEAKLYCDKNGVKFAYINPVGDTPSKNYIKSFVQNTPVFLEIPKKIKKILTHSNNNNNLPLCKFSRKFNNTEYARKYINTIGRQQNKFIITFTINKEQPNRSYLNGKVRGLSLTLLDKRSNISYEVDSIWGEKYQNIKDIPLNIANDRLKNIQNNTTPFNKETILQGNYAYQISKNLYFIMKNKHIAYIFNTTNRFLSEYNVMHSENELILEHKIIIRDHSYNFPLRVILTKITTNNSNSSNYLSNILYNNTYEYVEYNVDLQNNLVIEMEKLISIK